VTAPLPASLDLADRLPARQPGWWCWRCGWWQADMPGRWQPDACPECASWSRERRLPTDTLETVLVTVEMR
jgi:hypothetical protein